MKWGTKKSDETQQKVLPVEKGELAPATCSGSVSSTAESQPERRSLSFMSSLWKQSSTRRSSSRVQEEGSVQFNQESNDDDNNNQNQNTSVDVDNKIVEQPEKKRWTSLWGTRNTSTTNTTDASAEDDNQHHSIELEAAKNDSRTVRVHETPRIVKVHTTTGISRLSLTDTESNNNAQSVHDIGLEMLTGSLLIYMFADLREMARTGQIDSPELLQDFISVSHVMQAIQKHKDALAAQAIDHQEVGQRLTALKDVTSQQQLLETTDVRIEELLQGSALPSPNTTTAAMSSQRGGSQQSVLARFQDETSTKGVVYGIAVNHERKRVTILFRGSVTQQDFITDARSAQKRVDNPVLQKVMIDDNTQLQKLCPKDIRIHTGFHTYLFRKDKDGIVRLEHILNDAKALLKENPGYRLYCTGHSLGGACATLTGFYAATDDELVQHGPVVVISIASPQVGNHNFCDAFYLLEKLKRLQHLRIANKEDMITHLPFLTIKATAFSPFLSMILGAGNMYKHCGLHLELKSLLSVAEEDEEERNDEEQQASTTSSSRSRKKHYSICHPKGKKLEEEFSYSEEFKRHLEAAKLLVESLRPVAKADFDALTSFHSCREYEARLMAAGDYLSTITLDQLYQEEVLTEE